MRFAACLFVAFACSGALAGEPGQPGASESSPPPAAAQHKATAEVRQADDSDLSVKEWHSPISFDLDAGWLRTLPPGGTTKIEDLPSFYCDGVTLDRMEIQQRLEPTTKAVDLRIKFHLRARNNIDGDKVVALEFMVIDDEQRLRLGRRDELFISEGDSESWSVQFKIPSERIAAYAADGSHPHLRVAMTVRND